MRNGKCDRVFIAIDDLTTNLHAVINAGSETAKALLRTWLESMDAPIQSHGCGDPTSDYRRLMTIKEIAAYLNANERSIHNWMKTGGLPHRRVGSDLRFDMVEVDEWTKRHRENVHEISASNGKVRSLPT